jgi:hypothetical protein
MKRLALITSAALMLSIGSPAGAGNDSEARLATLLQNRVAGAPLDCIVFDESGPNNLTIVDHAAVVYRRGGTIYVNRTANPAILDWDDVLVVERFAGSTLCRHDRVFTHDRSGLGRTGVVFLEQFVPYTRAG